MFTTRSLLVILAETLVIFRFVLLFNSQCSVAFFSSATFIILSHHFLFVKNFFIYFSKKFLMLSVSNFDILSYRFSLVKNFFHFLFSSYFFRCHFVSDELYLTTTISLCQHFFSYFFKIVFQCFLALHEFVCIASTNHTILCLFSCHATISSTVCEHTQL